MITLIDVYCRFNRARGIELISPEDLLQACAIWEKLNVPVMFRRFDSRVIVIQSKAKNEEEVFARIKYLAVKPEALQTGVGASEAARTLGVAPALAKEYLLAAESNGFLCRDDGPDELRFYINFLKEINPNNTLCREEWLNTVLNASGWKSLYSANWKMTRRISPSYICRFPTGSQTYISYIHLQPECNFVCFGV